MIISDSLPNTISPRQEMLAYETLWALKDESLKSIAQRFQSHRLTPSQMLRKLFEEDLTLPSLVDDVTRFVSGLRGFSISIFGDYQYPKRLRDAKYPLELFYYKGDVGLFEKRLVSVVGTRKASEEGKLRTIKLAQGLVEAGFGIVSGLAAGIDTVAMQTAIESKGVTIGVIGTPITEYYPKENRELQNLVASTFCLLSQVPFYRYHHEPFESRRRYFPERNVTMAALSEATIIVEASETSGTLTQARACLDQGKKLFILNSCFETPGLTWPHTYEKRGAIRVRTINEILDNLNFAKCDDNNGQSLEED